MKVVCPECAREFDVPADVVIGEIVSCPDCGLDLEISDLTGGKVSVKLVRIEGEDWGE